MVQLLSNQDTSFKKNKTLSAKQPQKSYPHYHLTTSDFIQMAALNSTTMNASNIEAITSGLTNTVLGDDVVKADLATETSTKVDDVDAIANELGKKLLAGPDPADIAPEKATEEHDKSIDALGAACSSLSIDNNDAEAERQAQLLRDQIEKEHADKMTALANAEAKRETDAQLDQFTRQFQADLDALKLKEMKRKARKEKNEEAKR